MRANEAIQTATESTLAFYAGLLGGYADRIFGTKTRWTMYAYERIRTKTLNVQWLADFEQEINRALAQTGSAPITLRQLLDTRPNGQVASSVSTEPEYWCGSK